MSNSDFGGLFPLIWIASAVGGYFVGRAKGRAGLGLVLGLLLGLCGIVVIALIPATAAVKAQRMGGVTSFPPQGGYPPPGGFPPPGFPQPGSSQPGYPSSGFPQPGSAQQSGSQQGFPQTAFPQPGQMPPVPPLQQSQPAAWHPDPQGRYQLRYFDGTRWTEHVATNGVQAIDPV